MTAVLLRSPEWMRRAACAPYVARGDDWWHADDELPARERVLLFEQARAVCVTCPVQVACGRFGLELVPVDGAIAVYGGMTPEALRDIARRIGRPARKTARHGTRARYVNFKCRCDACRAANARGEAARRAARRGQRRDCLALNVLG